MGQQTSNLHRVVLDGVKVTVTESYTVDSKTEYDSETRCMYNSVDRGDGGVLYLLRNAERARHILRELAIHRLEKHQEHLPSLMEKAAKYTKLEELALLKCDDFQIALHAAYYLVEEEPPNLRSLRITFIRGLSDEEKQELRVLASARGWHVTVHAAAAEYTIPPRRKQKHE
jgi:hypothetical protein